jgi:hypothetical protein
MTDLNLKHLNFLEEFPKHLDHNEIIETLDQSKAPEWHETMVNGNIDYLEISYEESVPDFKRLEN